jgi:ribosome biogenesis protein Nip4
MKTLFAFANQFGAKIKLNPDLIAKKDNRYYFLRASLCRFVAGDFYYAGTYLGKVKGDHFFPSFNFLNILTESAENKVVLDRKASWLFICGRDVFREGIVKVSGSRRKGDFTLVFNGFGECLGFGRIVGSLDIDEGRVVVGNLLDVGDFLRRERHNF